MPARPCRSANGAGRAAVWLAVALLSIAAPAVAQKQGAIHLSVDVIYADNSGRGVDPALRGLGRQLKSFSYTTYRLEGQHQLFQSMGEAGRVSLPGGRLLLLTPQGMSGGSVVLLASIQQGGQVLLNTQLKLANHGTILVGGPVHEAGVLILAIGATTP